MKLFPDKNDKAFAILRKNIHGSVNERISNLPEDNKEWRIYNTKLALNTRKYNQMYLIDEMRKIGNAYKIKDNKTMIRKVEYANNIRMINVNIR
jgi:hypothetical protein